MLTLLQVEVVGSGSRVARWLTREIVDGEVHKVKDEETKEVTKKVRDMVGE